MNNELTSYCGLYCSDCIPSNEDLFSSIEKLDNLLEKLQFGEYANLRSKDRPKLSQYPIFSEMLKEMELLKCPAPCRNGGGKKECNIRVCCKSNNHEGCWECSNRESCYILKPLIKAHPNLHYHHDLIRDHGIDGWVQNRRAHYRWQGGNTP